MSFKQIEITQASPGQFDSTSQESLIYRLYKSDSDNIDTPSDVQANGTLVEVQVEGDGPEVTQWGYASHVTAEFEETGTFYINISVESPGVGVSIYNMRSITISSPGTLSVSTTSTDTIDVTQTSFSIRFERADDSENNPYEATYKLFTGSDENDVDNRISAENHDVQLTGYSVSGEGMGGSVASYGASGETVVMLVKTPHVTDQIYFYHGNDGINQTPVHAIGMLDDRIRISSGGSGVTAAATFPNNEWMILSARFGDGVNSQVHLDGSSIINTSNVQATGRDFISICTRNPTPFSLEAEIAYVVSFDGFLSNADRGQAENFVATQFGIDGFSSETDLPEPGHVIFDCREGVTLSGGRVTEWVSQGTNSVAITPYVHHERTLQAPVLSEIELNGHTPIHFNKYGYFHIDNLSPGQFIGGKVVVSNASEDTIIYDYFEELTLDEGDPPQQTSIERFSEPSSHTLIVEVNAIEEFEFSDPGDVGYEVEIDSMSIVDVGYVAGVQVGEKIIAHLPLDIVGDSIPESASYRVRGYNLEGAGQWSDFEGFQRGQEGEQSPPITFEPE